MSRPLGAKTAVRGLLFDLDGTLVDSSAAICEAAAHSFTALGFSVAPDLIRPHLGAPLHELYQCFVGDEDANGYHTFVTGYVEAHDAHPEAVPPACPGVVEGLQALAEAVGLPMAVATTKPTGRAAEQVRAVGLGRHFGWVQGTDPGMAAKPAPDVLLSAARGIGVEAGLTWMIGDTRRDVDAARAAGALAAVVAYDDEARERAAGFGADVVLSSLDELIPFLVRA